MWSAAKHRCTTYCQKSYREISIANSIFSFEDGGDVGNIKNYKHIQPTLGTLVKLVKRSS